MSVRFIVGRAGTGKTHRCVQAIRDQLRRDSVNGPRLIFLVPEQASLQMERALVAPDREPAKIESTPPAHRAEVMSFRRLAYRILESMPLSNRTALSESARAMVLRRLLRRESHRLRYYRQAGHLAGLFDRLNATVAEFIEEGIEPEALSLICERAPHSDPAQAAKWHDLELLYRAYRDDLGEHHLDPAGHLATAIPHLSRCPWASGAMLWVDGFASLSGQEINALLALAKRCAVVEISMMFDPALYDLPPGSPDGGDAMSLFSRTHRTCWDLRRRFVEADLEILKPVLLPQSSESVLENSGATGSLPARDFVGETETRADKLPVPPRFRASDDLAQLERGLFAPRGGTVWLTRSETGRDGSEPTASPAARPCHSPTPESRVARPCHPPRDIELVALPTRRLEVDYAVACIRRWIQDPARRYRYRDLAIIVRDLAPYHDLIGEALRARSIPFFLDQRRSMAHHPLVELLRALVLLVTEDFSLESIRLLLKTGLFPFSSEAADELENFLLARGISRREAWQRGDWTIAEKPSRRDERSGSPTAHNLAKLERINATRRTLLRVLGSWITFYQSSPSSLGADWSAALLEALNHLGVENTLSNWSAEAERQEQFDVADEHRTVLQDVYALLEDIGTAFPDTPLTPVELGEVLESGLSGLTLGLTPPMVDQLLVGSIDRSRHPDLKAVVILGFNDGLFPMRHAEDSILNDDDRELLEQAGLPVRPPSRRRVLDERMLVYAAFTRAAEGLVITYAGADEEGKTLRPSPYVNALLAACPGLAVRTVADPVAARETWSIQSPSDLVRHLTSEFRARPPFARDDLQIRSRWNALYGWNRKQVQTNSVFQAAARSLADSRADQLSPAMTARLFPPNRPLKTSVSQLETYATCPFQYFATHVLKLRKREEAELEAVDFGHVFHSVLEDFVGQVARNREGFGGFDEQDLFRRLRESYDRVAADLRTDESIASPRDAHVLRRAGDHLERVIRAQREVSRRGTTRPRAVEVAFGFEADSDSLPALRLKVADNREVLLRGYIDRVDIAESPEGPLGVVIDYKRTVDKHLSLAQVFHGLSLQLLAYLLVVARHGLKIDDRPIRPIAGLYVSLVPQYDVLSHPEEAAEEGVGGAQAHRPRGLIQAESFAALDAAAPSGKWSEAYSFYRKSDGSLGHLDRSDAAEADAFLALLNHTQRKLVELVEGILKGNVAVHPYRLGIFSPCTWCPMGSVCRFEVGLSPVRYLEALSRSQVLDRLMSKSE